MKRLLFLIFAVLIAVTPLTACDTMAVDDESEETADIGDTAPEIEDAEYYQRFKNDKISINVYGRSPFSNGLRNAAAPPGAPL